MKVDKNVRVDMKSLKMVVLDYFTDIVRLRTFQNIKNPNVEKTYGYTAYWFLREHPLHVITESPDCEGINEKFVISYLFPRVLREEKIPKERDVSPSLSQLIKLLFYNLKYRVYTQQTLELMLSAFFCGCKLGGQ
jgi:hypothetical protein